MSFELLGEESEFHWAIAVVDNLAKASIRRCRCYQVFNGPLPTNQPRTQYQVGWHLRIHRDAVLGASSKYRGGVVIGSIKKSELEKLDKMLSDHKPELAPRNSTWNCRDWVMEGIAMMNKKGWTVSNITSQEQLLPTLRAAHDASLKALEDNGSCVILELDHEL